MKAKKETKPGANSTSTQLETELSNTDETEDNEEAVQTAITSETTLSDHNQPPAASGSASEDVTKISIPHHYVHHHHRHAIPLTPPQNQHQSPSQVAPPSSQEHYYGSGNPMHVI